MFQQTPLTKNCLKEISMTMVWCFALWWIFAISEHPVFDSLTLKLALRSPSLSGAGAMLAMIGWLFGDASENLHLTAGPWDYITQHPRAAVGESRELHVWKWPVPHVKLRQLSHHSPRRLETKTAHWALQKTGNTLEKNIFQNIK